MSSGWYPAVFELSSQTTAEKKLYKKRWQPANAFLGRKFIALFSVLAIVATINCFRTFRGRTHRGNAPRQLMGGLHGGDDDPELAEILDFCLEMEGNEEATYSLPGRLNHPDLAANQPFQSGPQQDQHLQVSQASAPFSVMQQLSTPTYSFSAETDSDPWNEGEHSLLESLVAAGEPPDDSPARWPPPYSLTDPTHSDLAGGSYFSGTVQNNVPVAYSTTSTPSPYQGFQELSPCAEPYAHLHPCAVQASAMLGSERWRDPSYQHQTFDEFQTSSGHVYGAAPVGTQPRRWFGELDNNRSDPPVSRKRTNDQVTQEIGGAQDPGYGRPNLKRMRFSAIRALLGKTSGVDNKQTSSDALERAVQSVPLVWAPPEIDLATIETESSHDEASAPLSFPSLSAYEGLSSSASTHVGGIQLYDSSAGDYSLRPGLVHSDCSSRKEPHAVPARQPTPAFGTPVAEPLRSPSLLTTTQSTNDSQDRAPSVERVSPEPDSDPEQELVDHIFYRLPTLGKHVTPRKFSLTRAQGYKHVKTCFSTLAYMRAFLEKPRLDAWEADTVVTMSERLVGHLIYYQNTPLSTLTPSEAIAVLGRRFLILDALLCAIEALGPAMEADQWWPQVIPAVPAFWECKRRHFCVPRTKAYVLLAHRLSAAVEILKEGNRLGARETVELKRDDKTFLSR
ncbi:hypothetical protein, conserved [Eimeria necatrix]|uniref:Uncharacterized protein n=1 Tax=Eimeria necatrix TaxID=51315 RepID=U6MWK8_9EIME|nr:hypothetical protein, conserved [Eimeria necatrix]CDJ68361.1 hypothetical protein, conserved [Eimeria necatrix]